MNTPVSTQLKLQGVMQSLIQRSFLQYLALFVVSGLGAWLFLHYGTEWFKDAATGDIRIWEQAGVALGFAIVVALVAFFTRTL